MRSLLIGLLVLLWLILGWLYYQDYGKCCLGTKEDATTTDVMVRKGPILFAWASAVPILGESWPDMRDSLAMFATDSTSLEITGWYCKNSTPDETENTGLQRAMEVRKLFSGIPDDRIILLSKEFDCDSSYRSGNFEALAFNQRIRTKHIKEIDDRTLIYFPSNSTRKLNQDEVEAYLDDVAERVKNTGETVQLTGHTDGVGPADKNLILGQERADIIRQYLTEKGVGKDKITSVSKGETEPIAENNTAEGRSKNRRTELQIIK